MMKILDMHFKLAMALVFSFLVLSTCEAQRSMPLYTGKIPNSIPGADEEIWDKNHTVVSKVSHPALSVYLPSKETSTGTAVIICPGGGYGSLVIKKEGYDVAEYFARHGVAAFVLKYRLPSEKTMKDKSIGPLQDAQQAIRMVRHNAGEWNVDPGKVGIMGFSAGGHLASTAGTHFNQAVIDHEPNISLRPDFMILVYPVITFMDGLAHSRSRDSLLGRSPTEAQLKLYSNDLQVSNQTPRAFIVQAGDDQKVNVMNSIRFYEALNKHRIPADLHIYSKGDHGFALFPPFEEWMGRCLVWMKSNGF